MKPNILQLFFWKQPPEVFCKIKVFFEILQGLQLYYKRLWRRGFPVKFVTFLGIPFLPNTSRGLLLLWQHQIYYYQIYYKEFCIFREQMCYTFRRLQDSLSHQKRLTALSASNDQQAYGLLSSLHLILYSYLTWIY